MKKEHISSKKDDVREDYLANRVMAVFVAAVVLLFGLSYLWNAYNVARTFFAALRINTILIWVSAAALAGSLVWLASDLKKGRIKTAAVFNGAMSTVFLPSCSVRFCSSGIITARPSGSCMWSSRR